MAAIGAIPADALDGYTALGELALDGGLTPVAGVLPAAVAANGRGHGLICPMRAAARRPGPGADIEIVAPLSLIQLANHFQGVQTIARPEPKLAARAVDMPDLADIKGQESAKRALEIAAAGGHKPADERAARRRQIDAGRAAPVDPSALLPRELLEVSMVHSVAGALPDGALTDRRPFRAPHHSPAWRR